ncbi:MAG TPA: hypothetical protein VG652_02295 [Gaiellaceae bacterium]|nr:hypothetical protein [Gaiellaceae bacterium]
MRPKRTSIGAATGDESGLPSEAEIIREAPARFSLYYFAQERSFVGGLGLGDDFVAGYLDGSAGAALELSVARRELWSGGERLAAFAFGWSWGRADLLGHRPCAGQIERWLAGRVAFPNLEPQ